MPTAHTNTCICEITVPDSNGDNQTYDLHDKAAVHNATINPATKVINIEGNTVTFTLSGTSLTVTFGSAS